MEIIIVLKTGLSGLIRAKNKTYTNHHNDNEILEIEKLPIGCVNYVPIDFMHAVLLGVTQQI